MGNFVVLEIGFQNGEDKGIGRVLAELYLNKGLLEDMEIELGLGLFTKSLECWKLLFRCSTCHEVNKCFIRSIIFGVSA